MKTLLLLTFCITSVFASAATLGDDFDDNFVDTNKWGADILAGSHGFSETLGHLTYTMGTNAGAGAHPWILSYLPYDQNWEIQLTTYLGSSLMNPGERSAFGLQINNDGDITDRLLLYAFNTRGAAPPSIFGFAADVAANGSTVGSGSTGQLSTRDGRLRMLFDSSTKVVSCFVSTSSASNILIASFGLQSSGGATRNVNWGMAASNTFSIAIFGNSSALEVAGGAYADDFVITTPIVIPQTHDLAVTAVKAPKRISLSATEPNKTANVQVTIQNRSPHAETIANIAMLESLVTLDVQSSGACAKPFGILQSPKSPFPIVLQPGRSLKITYRVTFDCANDPLASTKTENHSDFTCVATVNHTAIDGEADTHPDCDTCPRSPVVEPNGKPDKGCRVVVTDVVVK